MRGATGRWSGRSPHWSADKANCEASKAAALNTLNEAILQNNHLRDAMPIMVIGSQPYVQTYEMQRGFSLN